MARSIGLKGKSLLCFLAIILITMIPIIATVVYKVADTAKATNESNVLRSLENLNSSLNDQKTNALYLSKAIAKDPRVMQMMEAKDSAGLLEALKPLIKDFHLDFVTATDEKGMVIVRTHDTKKGDSVTNQANVQKALLGSPYAAIESGTAVKLSARAGVPVYNSQGRLVGVISGGFDTSKNEVVDKAKGLSHTEITLFLNDERVATTIVKDGQRAIGTKLDPKIAEIVLKKGQPYLGNAQILGAEYVTAYTPLLGPDEKILGILFAGQSMSEAHQARNELILNILIIAVLVSLLALLFALVVAKKIANPIISLSHTMELVATGDLTQRSTVASNDEIGVLSNSINSMIQQLHELVARVMNLAECLATSSKELSINANNSSEASTQVVQSIAEIATSSMSTLSAFDHVGNNLEHMKAGIDQISENATIAVTSSQESLTVSEDGNKTIELVVEEMSKLGTLVETIASQVRKLSKQSQEIGSIIDTISGIAAQTNLLALNASIEAARAGEQGRGFSIVADEVRKLAEQTQDAAQNITAVIREVQKDTQEAVVSIELGSKEVIYSMEIANKAGESFKRIFTSVVDVSTKIKEIDMATTTIEADSNEIFGEMHNVINLNKEIAAKTQGVSAASQEQTASTEEIASSSHSLATMAGELEEVASKFKI